MIDHNEGGHHRRRGRDPFDSHDFIFGTGFPFVFRDPEDVFREFFGGNPFDDFFNLTGHGSRRQPNAAGASRQHRSSHPTTTNVMSPFLSFSLMDDMFSPFNSIGMHHNTGFSSSLSTYDGVNGIVGVGGGGNVKRISTSTSFNNGRKVTTKK